MFTAFVAIKCASLGKQLGPTSFFDWHESAFLSQYVLLICVTTHVSKCREARAHYQ